MKYNLTYAVMTISERIEGTSRYKVKCVPSPSTYTQPAFHAR